MKGGGLGCVLVRGGMDGGVGLGRVGGGVVLIIYQMLCKQGLN